MKKLTIKTQVLSLSMALLTTLTLTACGGARQSAKSTGITGQIASVQNQLKEIDNVSKMLKQADSTADELLRAASPAGSVATVSKKSDKTHTPAKPAPTPSDNEFFDMTCGGGVCQYFGEAEHVTMPEKACAVFSGAFDHLENLVSVTFPESVEMIESTTCISCPNLTTLTFLGDDMMVDILFACGCPNLTSIVFHGMNITVDDRQPGPLFADCGDVTIYAPEGSTMQAYAEQNGIPFAAIEP